MVLVPGKTEEHQLMVCSVDAMLSRQESQKKSERLSEVFAAKRARVARGDGMFHTSLPWWLQTNPETERPEAIPERAAVVKRIFELVAAGNSCERVGAIFNREGVPTWRPQPIWRTSRIRDVVRSDRAVGLFLPTLKSKRAGRDFAIGGYYPSVVSRELAEQARAVMRRNIRGSRGRIVY